MQNEAKGNLLITSHGFAQGVSSLWHSGRDLSKRRDCLKAVILRERRVSRPDRYQHLKTCKTSR